MHYEVNESMLFMIQHLDWQILFFIYITSIDELFMCLSVTLTFACLAYFYVSPVWSNRCCWPASEAGRDSPQCGIGRWIHTSLCGLRSKYFWLFKCNVHIAWTTVFLNTNSFPFVVFSILAFYRLYSQVKGTLSQMSEFLWTVPLNKNMANYFLL